MPNIKATIQYDGTNYHGWQIQANGRTIQGELTRVVSLLAHHPVVIRGAGRTDAGVHAEGQVANFLLDDPLDLFELRNAINGNLDRDIRVTRVEIAPEDFDARRSALNKAYRYRICTSDVVSPFLFRYAYHYRASLSADKMQKAGDYLLGTHNFSAFTIDDNGDRVRTISILRIEESAGEMLIHVEGKAFLRYMVRTIAGTLIEVGRGRRTPESVAETLHSRERSSAGPTAPACGLTLIRVDY